jgi:hypothetical protein
MRSIRLTTACYCQAYRDGMMRGAPSVPNGRYDYVVPIVHFFIRGILWKEQL